MKTHHGILKRIAKLGLLLLLGASMSACGNSTSWKEEVLLHDGSKIIAERYVDRGGRSEIGQEPPYKEQSLSFAMPGINQTVIWEDHYSQDLGMANFLPKALDIQSGVAYLVASPMGCLSYNKWGRPNPPYVIFKYSGKEWNRIPLQELPAEIKAFNLIGSSPDTEVKKSGKHFFTAEMIKAINADYKQPEYKSILREGIKREGQETCPKMISYGKNGGWLGLDWFTGEASLEACLKVCNHKGVSAETCPCNTLFKGK